METDESDGMKKKLTDKKNHHWCSIQCKKIHVSWPVIKCSFRDSEIVRIFVIKKSIFSLIKNTSYCVINWITRKVQVFFAYIFATITKGWIVITGKNYIHGHAYSE